MKKSDWFEEIKEDGYQILMAMGGEEKSGKGKEKWWWVASGG